ncbi:hypothetical protein ASZ90_004785 [hydrocarbon metagenome]|uniref:DUF4097 domain-containing protein n=1 Tax=hydrocarbon metagenome TaxID=938273 RepID=A0A0W8FX44_9ZZZZ
MNKTIAILLLLISTVVFAQRDLITKTVEAKKGGTFELEVNPGDISIKTWDRNEVQIKVDGLDDEEAEYLEVKTFGDKISVRYKSRFGWGGDADYFVSLPSEMNLVLITTGGDINIQDNINGSIKVNTMGGDIDLQNVNGDVQLETLGGDISFKNISGSTSVSSHGGDIFGGNISGSSSELKTMGGDIRLNKISNVKKVTTFGGNIDVKESSGDVELTTFGGNIKLEKGENGVKAKTYGGNIFIGKANGYVDANTGGGNIELKQITGSVKARTAAGNIHVELESLSNKDSDIETFSGDITLLIPASIKATVKAQAISVAWGRDKNKIINSDFTGEIDDKRGSTIGNFAINGGGTKVNLKTNMGGIQIKKK